MKYYWPLVLIGGTLLVIGAALPSFRGSGGFPLISQPSSWYLTGIQYGGIPWAIGGGVLLFIALISRGAPGSRSLALIVSVLCFLLIAAASIFQPICGDCPTYAPAFGLNVSLLGVALSFVGSLMPLSDPTIMTRIAVMMLMVFELLIVGAGMALARHPVAGDWLRLWYTDLPREPCGLNSPYASNQVNGHLAPCYATATAKAIELTPPAWWPLDQSTVPYRKEKQPAQGTMVSLQDVAAHPESYKGQWVEIHDAPILHVYCPSQFTIGTPSASVYLVSSSLPLSFQDGDNIGLIIGLVGGDCKRQHPGKAIICGLTWASGPPIGRPPPPWWQFCLP